MTVPQPAEGRSDPSIAVPPLVLVVDGLDEVLGGGVLVLSCKRGLLVIERASRQARCTKQCRKGELRPQFNHDLRLLPGADAA